MKLGFIYLHRNVINKKCYIGQTWQQPERRWRKADPSYTTYKPCLAFYRALVKYGWENFESTILATATSEAELNALEERYMKEYDSLGENGYNIRELANGRAINSPETRARISKARKGKDIGKVKENTRVPHVMIDGVESKECSKCHVTKPLTDFGSNARKNRAGSHVIGDGHDWYCLPCKSEFNSRYTYKRVHPQTKLASRREATAKMQKTIQAKFDNDPNYKRAISISKGPAYKATNPDTGEVRIFECGQDVKAAGFNISGVCNSAAGRGKSGGYVWSIIKREDYVK